MSKTLDIIVFGASGFTGKHVVRVLEKLVRKENNKFIWGVAGRSFEKLKSTLQLCEKETGSSLDHIPIVIANTDNENSLKQMAQKTRLVINCCGPYRFYGEAVVKACIDEGTHHLDVSGEPHYMEKIQLDYDKKAREKKVYVISACGTDSIPIDLGLVFLEKHFEGRLNSVVTYMKMESEAHEKPYVNDATWKSLIYGIANAKDLVELRKKLFKNRLPSVGPKLKLKTRPHKTDLLQGWAVPFLGADRSVVKRSQYSFYNMENKNPIQIETYHVMDSLLNLFLMYFVGTIDLKLMNYKCGRDLLIKYPGLFSNGIFGEQPKEEVLKNLHFTVMLYGEGWKDKSISDFNKPHNHSICARIKATDPFYTTASYCVVLSALTLLSEEDKLPSGGGVYAPGYAFAKTSLLDRLAENGYGYEIVFHKDIVKSKL